MNFSNKVSSVVLGAFVVLFMTGNAFAITEARTQVQHAAGSCQGNLPVSATQLRARPLAIANEGTASAFISCSLGADDYNEALNGYNGVVVTNRTAAEVNISCTLAAGGIEAAAVFFTRTVAIPAGALSVVPFDMADNGGNPIPNSLNYSCSIPPGVEINAVFTNIEEDIGA